MYHLEMYRAVLPSIQMFRLQMTQHQKNLLYKLIYFLQIKNKNPIKDGLKNLILTLKINCYYKIILNKLKFSKQKNIKQKFVFE